MRRLFLLPATAKEDGAVNAWFDMPQPALGNLARHWFDVVCACGDDIGVLLHDGHPTACVADAAFAYVNAFATHVNLGFFNGSELDDPHGLLEGTGKYMRHVKLRPDTEINATALTGLIHAAYDDVKGQLGDA